MTLTTVEKDDDCCGKDFWSCYGAREGRDESIIGRKHATDTAAVLNTHHQPGLPLHWMPSDEVSANKHTVQRLKDWI